MTVDTILQAASISKSVSAVAALQMVEQGKLSLDVDINADLRSWHVPPGAQTNGSPITLRRVLSHSAGFTVPGFDGYVVGSKVPTLLDVLDGLAPANSAPVRVDILPGTQWRYSGGGYAVLQQLLEDTSTEPFAPMMQHAVLVPAGMKSSFFAPAGELSPSQQASVAVGHQDGKPIAGNYRIHPELSAAGLWTTPSDLARFNLSLAHLLAPSTLKQALTPQFDQSGLGFVLDPSTGRYGHDGSNAGFESRWQADTKDGGRAVVVMANSNGTRSVMNELIRSVAVAQGWTDWMPPTHASLVAKVAATPVFIRGNFNDWATNMPMKAFAPQRFIATTASKVPAGRVEFKIASEDWSTVDLGSTAKVIGGTHRPIALSFGGGNLVLDLPKPGRYRFELDARDHSTAYLRVTKVP